MQFQVPQFIETEDKIIGPFSLRQFAYVGAAGVLSAMAYFALASWLWIIISLVLFGVAFAMAFIKIEGRPFLNVMISAFSFYWKPQTYVWQAEHPTVAAAPKKIVENDSSALQAILSASAESTKRAFPKLTPKTTTERPAVIKPAIQPIESPKPAVGTVSRESVAVGSTLHKIWEAAQTGTALAQKNSDKQFLEKKMAERYQIFQRPTGERNAAKRVDYR